MVKQKCSRILSVFIALFLVFSIVSPVSVFAFEAGEKDNWVVAGSFPTGDISTETIQTVLGDANVKLGAQEQPGTATELAVKIKGVYYSLLKLENSTLKVNKTVWSQAKDADVSKSMRNFVDSLTNSGATPDAIQQVMANLQDSDTSVSSVMLPLIFESTKGDMYQAYKITSPFLEILSVVLGVGAVLLILLLLFSTVMDLAYIGLPVWREAQASKNGGQKNPFGVSYEALTTVKEVEKGLGGGDGGYRNAYLLYFKRRALTYIILAICIFYLICGGLSGIIGFVLNLVSGITG